MRFCDPDHFSGYPHQHLHDEITGFLQGSGIPHLDLLDAFREAGRRPHMFRTISGIRTRKDTD